MTPAGIAKLLRVSPEEVLGWIRHGKLRAFDVGDSFRPRYRVNREDPRQFSENLSGSTVPATFTPKAPTP
jgi:excisionase family DNA binding protein